ncbi:G-D-S-L family lipolytic protein [uncultured Maribacter sp.]|uniref:G-D-S-L family lipolytic protein n=1 Tax=uncultured Maribacter sp. TaxID=431308 RepID=UPI002615332C|nr:G-D-S-L family lipolytic protein [uncultured Maribacter sp.]
MKNIKYILLASVIIFFVSCNDIEDVDLNTIEEVAELPELTAGTADFSNYVALGASFTAGFTDGALFRAGQENSFPNLLSQQFVKVEEAAFTQPLMNDNTGGLLLPDPIPNLAYRLIFNGSGPQRLNSFFSDLGAPVPPITTNAGNLGSSFNNVGVPGAKSFHVTFPGYGGLNPYFGRMASSASATMLGDALSQNPTFFTLSDLGGNDVLSFATSGGVGEDQTGNLNPSTYGSNDITDPNVFANVMSGIVTALTANGAKGVITNVPYVKDLPYFTSVPNNALVLDAAKAGQLTGVFQAVSGIFLQGLVLQGIPLEQAQALAAQYAITFNEGPNRWIIDVPVTQMNPLGFRQMTEEELLVLPIDQAALAQGYGTVALTDDVLQVLGLLQAGGTPTPEQAGLVIAAVNGIDDKDALDSDELASIKNATDAYNDTILTLANSNENIALVDLNGILTQLAATGVDFDEYTLEAKLVTGGAISLDGIHLTARGYAFMANKFLEAIDMQFGSNFIASGNVFKAGDYPTNYSPTLQ